MKKRKETRIEIIDETGRVYVRWDCEITESIQDNGKTVKFFVKNE